MELLSSIHAVAGFIVALTGLAQILMKKGGGTHAIIGFTYLVAWLIVVVSGSFIGSPVIALFGMLGFYMAITGWRFANRRRTKAKTIDKVIFWTGLIAALVTLAWGILLINDSKAIGWVASAFGLIFTLTTAKDVFKYVLKKKRNKTTEHRKQWMFEHLIRMYISYVAAMTAFIVINDIFHQYYLNWLLPTVIGTVIIFTSVKFQKNKVAKKESREQA